MFCVWGLEFLVKGSGFSVLGFVFWDFVFGV